ncbi:arabidopsis phospholipase-like protein [Striga asiatica]|uniref:Arabidopsis phospholipase-like protein n=1 Tax=Striga asiatica TaxID=4170 RepID=A0A5A7QRB6_STRAF|nr:arabidopsis phospholipase-like protein [Striga asiatica]
MAGTKRGRAGARKTGKSCPAKVKPAPPEPSQGSATIHSDSADLDFLPSRTVLRNVRARSASLRYPFRSSGTLHNAASEQTPKDLASQAPAGSPEQSILNNIHNTEEEHSSPLRRADNTKVANSSKGKSPSLEPIISQPVKYIDIQVPLIQCHNEKSTTHSFNVTENARGLHVSMEEEDPDDEEVESSLEPGFELVHGHKVRTETAPLIRSIFEKHGDIMSGTHMESPVSISNSLEQLSGVCGRLQRARFVELTRAELDAMLADVRDMERAGLRIVWLRERLEFVSRTWTDYSHYFRMKELVAENELSIGGLEKELDECRQQHLEMGRKISGLEDEVAAKRERTERMRSAVVSTRSRVKGLVDQSLVEGLL